MVGIVPKMVVVDGHGPQLSKEPSFVHVRQLEKAVHKKKLKRHGSTPGYYTHKIEDIMVDKIILISLIDQSI